MHRSVVSLIALASTPLVLAQLASTPVAPTLPSTLSPLVAPSPPTVPTASIYPITQILPVPGWNSTTDSFDTLASLYASSAAQLSSQAVALAQKNVQLSGSGGVQYSYDVQASLASSLVTVNNLFWQTAYQAERKVCAIVSSIKEQNVNAVKGQLLVAITAEVQAIVSITVTITNTIAAVQSQIAQFTAAERAVLTALIQAIVAAAAASTGPVATLNAGLSAIGVTALSDVTQSLQTAVVGLQSAAAINWTVE